MNGQIFSRQELQDSRAYLKKMKNQEKRWSKLIKKWGNYNRELIPILEQPEISKNKNLSQRFKLLIEVTDYARRYPNCFRCANHSPTKSEEEKAVKQFIRDSFGFSFEEINKEIREEKFKILHIKNFLREEHGFEDCFAPDHLCEAIANIVIKKCQEGKLQLPRIGKM